MKPEEYRRSYRIGDRDRRITIERETVERTNTGAERKEWISFKRVWAERRDIRADKEDSESGAVVATHQVRWVIRYRADIDYTDRIRYNGDIYEIVAIAEQGRRDLLILDTTLVI